MKYNEIELAAGLRLLFSNDHLVCLRKAEMESKDQIYPDRKSGSGGSNTSGLRHIEIPIDLLDSVPQLKSYINSFISKNGNVNMILIPTVGTFAVAESAADLDFMFSGREAQSLDRPKLRMHNKVVVITGGAQGFGAGLAESFFKEGANLVIADVNELVGKDFAEDLNSRDTPNKALFIQCDVSDFYSVKKVIDKTVFHFGGVDVMISNAGILRAGGLDEMTPENFELMTKVNYSGYFNCAKAASAIMKTQSEFTDMRHFDILQINSKSGLRGSNKNFAYAGGKFGGIGLTQSFALELMPYRIKVNSICPGNFFDGPLWSDPEKGLFVQYLNAGKIPGAKSVADVRQYYEKQVPAGRGCETGDVAKAAFYAIEQEYETGQAIPVTGGQVMLN